MSKGAKPASKQQRQANNRRINGLKGNLRKQAANPKLTPGEIARLKALLAELDRAERLNRLDNNDWLVGMILADSWGRYQGYYDYYAIYDPGYLVYYQDGVSYWSTTYEYYETSYISSYESYSWSYYEDRND